VFGHKWEPALGTITGVEPDPRQRHAPVYLVDVPMAGGGLPVRVAPLRWMSPDLPPGTQVKVQVNAKTGEVRFDPSPIAGFSPGQIESPGGAAGASWPGDGAPRGVNVTVNVGQDGAAGSIEDVAEIVSRLGGEAAGNAVAAALANLGSGLTGGPGQPGQPRQPGTAEVPVTAGNPEVRVVSGAEAAEFMREFFGNRQVPEQPADDV